MICVHPGTSSHTPGSGSTDFTTAMLAYTGLSVDLTASYSYAFSATSGDVTSGRKAYARSYKGPATLMTSFGERLTPGVDVADTCKAHPWRYVLL